MEKVVTTPPVYESPPIPGSAVPEESCCVRLSERDAAEVMATAENPPAPTAAALNAATRLLQQNG